jgi:hypothetical protein
VARGLTASFGLQSSFYPALPVAGPIAPVSFGAGAGLLFHLVARGLTASFGFQSP